VGASACAAAGAEGVSADLGVSSAVESGFVAQRDCNMVYVTARVKICKNRGYCSNKSMAGMWMLCARDAHLHHGGTNVA
jgi:hypothetical protein